MIDVETRFKTPRLRSKRHLDRLKTLPCSIPGCKGQPVDPHHVTFAQPSAKGLKVSDEFTVPLCHWRHHDPRSMASVHFVGNEREWWARHGLDPIAIAEHHATVSRALGILK